MAERIRLTISVSPEAHAAFLRMAEASGMSLGRCMGEWLDDTSEGVEFVTSKLIAAREAPIRVIRELQATMRSAAREAESAAEVAIQSARKARKASADRAGAQSPRPVIRGVKSPGKTL